MKIFKIQPLDLYFLFLMFLLAFTSADIVFHKFLEIHSTLSEKKIFVTNFSFFNRFTPMPPPLNSQNLLSMQKFFY